MIPERNYWEEFGDCLDVRFLNMDMHQFIVDSGVAVPPAVRKLYNPGVYCVRGYQILGLSDEFSLSVLDQENVNCTSELLGEAAVQIGAFASGALLILTKRDPNVVKIWDYGPDSAGKRFATPTCSAGLRHLLEPHHSRSLRIGYAGVRLLLTYER